MSLTKASYSMVTGAPVNVVDYGADPTGIANSSTAIQLAIDSGVSKKIYFPTGTYRIDTTIVFDSFTLLEVDFGGSTLTWNGSSGGSVVTIKDCQSCTFFNAKVTSSSTKPALAAFTLENGSGVLVAPNKLVFSQIVCEGTNLNGMTYGFNVSGTGGGGDANNDFHYFENCTCYNYKDAGWYVAATQAYGLILTNCGMVSANGASGSAAFFHAGNGGSVQIIGGGGGNNTYADFVFAGPGRPVNITNYASEGSAAFLRTEGTGSSFFPVNLTNCLWETDTAALIYSDKKVVYFTYQGQLSIDGCNFLSLDSTANFTLEVTGDSDYAQNAGQIRSTVVTTQNANPLVGMWNVDNTSVRSRAPLSLSTLTLNSKIFGTGQPNGVNSATITLAGADTVIFESGSINVSAIVQKTGIAGVRGQQVTFIFNTAITIVNGANLKLAGGVDFVSTTNDTLTLVYNGSGSSAGIWTEVSRSVN